MNLYYIKTIMGNTLIKKDVKEEIKNEIKIDIKEENTAIKFCQICKEYFYVNNTCYECILNHDEFCKCINSQRFNSELTYILNEDKIETCLKNNYFEKFFKRVYIRLYNLFISSKKTKLKIKELDDRITKLENYILNNSKII